MTLATGQVAGLDWWACLRWKGTGEALLVRLFPGGTGESGEDDQTVRAAPLGLDMDMDMDMEQQAAELGSVPLKKRLSVLLLCAPAQICACCCSRRSLELDLSSVKRQTL